MSRQTEALEGKYTNYLQSLVEIKEEVDGLVEDLGLVSGSSDVDGMLPNRQIILTQFADWTERYVGLINEGDNRGC